MLSPSWRYHWRLKISRCWRRYRQLLCDVAIGVTICLILSLLVVKTVRAVRPRHASVKPVLDLSDSQTVDIIRILKSETRGY